MSEGYNLCNDAIIDFVATSRRFVPHFHMPWQSGSDVILQRMHLRYDTALYAELVARIKQLTPDACIGVDVITGTPSETEEEFVKTHALLRSIAVDHLHVFAYSARANTSAVRMEDAVPREQCRERTKQLSILSSKLQRAFYEKYIGTTRTVLFEAEESADLMHGCTDNYIRVGEAMEHFRLPQYLVFGGGYPQNRTIGPVRPKQCNASLSVGRRCCGLATA